MPNDEEADFSCPTCGSTCTKAELISCDSCDAEICNKCDNGGYCEDCANEMDEEAGA